MKKFFSFLFCLMIVFQSHVFAQNQLPDWAFFNEEDMSFPEVDPFMVEGNIVSAGSSTVFPLLERMIERFVDEGFMSNISLDSVGSGAGFERFCTTGETDISNSSRPIKAQEVENCRSIEREPIEFRIGSDALAVVTSRENHFMRNASLEELKKIFSTAVKWSDVNSNWPDQPIFRFVPGTDSGSFDYFVEEVFDHDKEPLLSTTNLQMSEDDNILIQGVMGSPYAIGFVGYAYYQANRESLNILDIEGIEASKESVDNASYPLARPLYIYTTDSIMRDKPQVAAFINFILSYVNEEIASVGYFPADQTTLLDAKEMWLEIMRF